MKQLQAIIVEDEQMSRQLLRNYVQKYCPQVTILGEAENIDEALVLIRNNELDLVFLDVEMPFGNAFDLLDKIPNPNFQVVFVTAYEHYAMEALNKQAAYYLLKPISIDALIKAVDHVLELKQKEEQLEKELTVVSHSSTNEKITIPTQDGFEVIAVQQIIYAKADDNYTELYLRDGHKKVVSKNLKYFEQLLSGYSFARIHKSYLINVQEIVGYKKGKGGEVELSNGKILSVASSRKSALLAFFKS